MNHPEIDKAIAKAKHLYKDIFILGGSLEDYEIGVLRDLAICAKSEYYQGTPFMPDDEYDVLERYIALASPEDDVTKVIGSEVRGDAVPLPFTMSGLVQVYEGEVGKWVEKNHLATETFVVSDKLDGNSVQLVYDATGTFTAAFTRGDGFEGVDITRHLKQMGFPKKVDAGIRGVRAEIILKKEKFQNVQVIAKRTYKNPRNMVGGLMNASESLPAVLTELSVVAYEIMNDAATFKSKQLERLFNNGFEVPHYRILKSTDLTDELLSERLVISRNNSDYEIDGLVIDVESASIRSTIKPTTETLDPEYARKYKVADASNMAVTTCTDVLIGISKAGYLKPRVEIEPVELVGATVKYATGFNMGFILKNKLAPGAKVRITRSGDVIPFIVEVMEPSTIEDYDLWFNTLLNNIGEWTWTETMVDAFLLSDHPTVALERAKDFFTILDVPLLREGNLTKLFDAGYNTPQKIIKMDLSEMLSIVGENARKIHEALHQKLRPVKLTTFMAATGLLGRGVGTRKLKALYEAAQGNEEVFSDYDAIVRTPGFQHKTATRIIKGYDSFVKFVDEVRDYVEFATFTGPSTDGELAGQVYVFTGFRDKEMQAKIESQGGTVGDSFTSKTTCVVAQDPNEKSGKLDKARAKGVRIMGRDELAKTLE